MVLTILKNVVEAPGFASRIPGCRQRYFSLKIMAGFAEVPLENHYEKATDSFVANLFVEHSTFRSSRWRKLWYTAPLPFSILQLQPKLLCSTGLLRRILSPTVLCAS